MDNWRFWVEPLKLNWAMCFYQHLESLKRNTSIESSLKLNFFFIFFTQWSQRRLSIWGLNWPRKIVLAGRWSYWMAIHLSHLWLSKLLRRHCLPLQWPRLNLLLRWLRTAPVWLCSRRDRRTTWFVLNKMKHFWFSCLAKVSHTWNVLTILSV